MSVNLAWDNLVTYSLQVGLLVGLAAFVPSLLRLRLPRARLLYWHVLLAACLLLPLLGARRHEVKSGGNVEFTTGAIVPVAPGKAPSRTYSRAEIGLALLAFGALLRLGWLGVGFWRLNRYRRHARPFQMPVSGCPALLSDDVTSPVTFGLLRPVILLPAQFPDLDYAKQQAILCHETLHIERKDWLFTIVEEFIRAAFWFHPAIWWLLGEIQLAREQAVDQETIGRTNAREEYVDALLAIAGAGHQPDLAPAPLFLRKRHLKQRLVSILKDARMSRARWMSALAAGLAILAVASWFVTASFPLSAAPQVVNDADGIAVNVGAATLLHRTPVAYPDSARRLGIQGAVLLEAILDNGGNVTDARVVSGPDGLRAPALQSVLQWHFAGGSQGATRQVAIDFRLPPATPQRRIETQLQALAAREQQRRQLQSALDPSGIRRAVPPVSEAQPHRPELPSNGSVPVAGGVSAPAPNPRLATIAFLGVAEQTKNDLQNRLPLHEGDILTPESVERAAAVVREVDEHLKLVTGKASNGEAAISIVSPDYRPAAPERIKIGGDIQQAKLVRQSAPVYPQLAKQARISGVVKLSVIIAKDGAVSRIEVISGHPLLVPAALEAVRQWAYQPTLLNGQPIEVLTQVDVNFTLTE